MTGAFGENIELRRRQQAADQPGGVPRTLWWMPCVSASMTAAAAVPPASAPRKGSRSTTDSLAQAHHDREQRAAHGLNAARSTEWNGAMNRRTGSDRHFTYSRKPWCTLHQTSTRCDRDRDPVLFGLRPIFNSLLVRAPHGIRIDQGLGLFALVIAPAQRRDAHRKRAISVSSPAANAPCTRIAVVRETRPALDRLCFAKSGESGRKRRRLFRR